MVLCNLHSVKNIHMSLHEFTATADVGISVLSVDSSSLFHSYCKRTASLKSSNSDENTTGRYGKLQVAEVLRRGKFIAHIPPLRFSFWVNAFFLLHVAPFILL